MRRKAHLVWSCTPHTVEVRLSSFTWTRAELIGYTPEGRRYVYFPGGESGPRIVDGERVRDVTQQ